MNKQRTTTTHLAGPPISIMERVIQRCAICGEKLCDNLNCAMPIEADGSIPLFPVWRQGDFVQMEGNRSSVIGSIFADSGGIPEDICLDLVE